MLGNRSPEELQRRAFAFVKELAPKEFAVLQANGNVPPDSGYLTGLLPHFLSLYAFKGYNLGATHTHQGYDKRDMAIVLDQLLKGNVGTLGGTRWKGGHLVSLLGIEERQVGDIHKLITLLKNEQMPPQSLTQGIQLIIYDQLKQAPLERVPLQTVLDSGSDAAGYFTLRIASTDKVDALRKPIEKLWSGSNTRSPFSYVVESKGFIQNLLRTGSRHFG